LQAGSRDIILHSFAFQKGSGTINKFKFLIMRKFFFTLMLSLVFALGVQAQATIPEPTLAEQTLILTSDTGGALLDTENGTLKVKSGTSPSLIIAGKVKATLTLQGVASISKDRGGKTTRLIVKAKGNATDPNSFMDILKFQVKGKERRYQFAGTDTPSSSETGNLSRIQYNAKRYGQSSFLITMDNLTPGEYGVVFRDSITGNTQDSLKVTTFTVK
jgi:hypothetical protein